MPEALARLINDVAEMKNLLQMQVADEQNPEKPQLIGVYKAAKVIGKSIGTVYNLTSTKRIPHYKSGNQLYFIEEELISYIMEKKMYQR